MKKTAMSPPQRRAAIRDELAAITESGGGRLAPQRVVDWARVNRASALHGYFMWDDSKAGEQYRLWQARELIVSVEAVYHDGKRRQVYVSLRVQRSDRKGYSELVMVMNDEEQRAHLLADALAELERLCNRYRDLAELAGVREAVRLVRVREREVA